MHLFKDYLICQRNWFARTIPLVLLVFMPFLTNGQMWAGISSGINFNRVVTNNSDEPYLNRAKIRSQL